MQVSPQRLPRAHDSLLQKMVLVGTANFPVHENCTGGTFLITHQSKFYESPKLCIIRDVSALSDRQMGNRRL